MVQPQPDIYILSSLLLPYFLRDKIAEWTVYDIIETKKNRLERMLWIIPFYIVKSSCW
jgi:hypothetical protein